LGVLQVISNHHLQDLEQLAVADVAVVVDVVNSTKNVGKWTTKLWGRVQGSRFLSGKQQPPPA